MIDGGDSECNIETGETCEFMQAAWYQELNGGGAGIFRFHLITKDGISYVSAPYYNVGRQTKKNNQKLPLFLCPWCGVSYKGWNDKALERARAKALGEVEG